MAPDEEYGDDDLFYETKPAIPTALPKQDENPLPILPMLVLSIVRQIERQFLMDPILK